MGVASYASPLHSCWPALACGGGGGGDAREGCGGDGGVDGGCGLLPRDVGDGRGYAWRGERLACRDERWLGAC